jgi:hypothetical protein
MQETIFRENDIRGTYPEEINELVMKDIAIGIAKKCKSEGVDSIAVARDGRLSGEPLLTNFCEAILNCGINVNCIGLATSPMLYFAAKKEKSKSGIMITGSHNPKNYNGIKMVINNSSVSGNEILTLIKDGKELTTTMRGQITYSDIKDTYIKEVIDSVEEDLSDLKGLTAPQIEYRYNEVEKVVYVHDTIPLTPMDTCKQTVIYYTTRLKGTEALLKTSEAIGKKKEKVIDDLQDNLLKISDNNTHLKRKLKKSKKKVIRWKLAAAALAALHLVR